MEGEINLKKLVVFIFLLILLAACTKEKTEPENSVDKQTDYDSNSDNTDSSNIDSIQKDEIEDNSSSTNINPTENPTDKNSNNTSNNSINKDVDNSTGTVEDNTTNNASNDPANNSAKNAFNNTSNNSPNNSTDNASDTNNTSNQTSENVSDHKDGQSIVDQMFSEKNMVFIGAIGDTSIHVTLKNKNNRLTGVYYSDQDKDEIKLYGSIEFSSYQDYPSIYIDEDGGEDGGRFTGIIRSKDCIQGYWVKPDGILPMYLLRAGSDTVFTKKPSKEAMLFEGQWKGANSTFYEGSDLDIKVLFDDLIYYRFYAYHPTVGGYLDGLGIINNKKATTVFRSNVWAGNKLIYGDPVTFELSLGEKGIYLNSSDYGYGCGEGVYFDNEYTDKIVIARPSALELGIVNTQEQEEEFQAMVGDFYEKFIRYTQSVEYSDAIIDGKKVRSGTSYYKGLSGLCYYILSPSYLYAAILENGSIEYFTNDPKYSKGIPLAMKEWVMGLSVGVHINFFDENNVEASDSEVKQHILNISKDKVSVDNISVKDTKPVEALDSTMSTEWMELSENNPISIETSISQSSNPADLTKMQHYWEAKYKISNYTYDLFNGCWRFTETAGNNFYYYSMLDEFTINYSPNAPIMKRFYLSDGVFYMEHVDSEEMFYDPYEDEEGNIYAIFGDYMARKYTYISKMDSHGKTLAKIRISDLLGDGLTFEGFSLIKQDIIAVLFTGNKNNKRITQLQVIDMRKEKMLKIINLEDGSSRFIKSDGEHFILCSSSFQKVYVFDTDSYKLVNTVDTTKCKELGEYEWMTNGWERGRYSNLSYDVDIKDGKIYFLRHSGIYVTDCMKSEFYKILDGSRYADFKNQLYKYTSFFVGENEEFYILGVYDDAESATFMWHYTK